MCVCIKNNFYTGITNLRIFSVTMNKITVVWDLTDSNYTSRCEVYYHVTIMNSVNTSDMNITESDERTTEFCNL